METLKYAHYIFIKILMDLIFYAPLKMLENVICGECQLLL